MDGLLRFDLFKVCDRDAVVDDHQVEYSSRPGIHLRTLDPALHAIEGLLSTKQFRIEMTTVKEPVFSRPSAAVIQWVVFFRFDPCS